MWISPRTPEFEKSLDSRVAYKVGDNATRPWGKWEVVDVGLRHIVKRLVFNPEHQCSLQKHAGRHEHWIIVSGKASYEIGNLSGNLYPTQCAFIPAGISHRIRNASKSLPLEFIEIQSGELLCETDIIRLDDDYGRVV